MKALVLAGGSGTRLRPLTHSSAKQLVPVANKPVLFYGLEAIAEAGITEVGLIVNPRAREIREAVGDGSRFGVQVTYLVQEAPLGLAHAVLVARDYLGEDDFVMYLGDNFVVGGIRDLVTAFRAERPDASLLLTEVPDPTAFGVAELDAEGRVVTLEEKPARPRSDLALVGVYLFTPAVHEAVAALKPSARGELEITDALQWLVDRGRTVRSTRITGYWKDTGDAEAMLEVNRQVLESLRSRVEGSVDAASELRGPVVVEAGATVVRSRLEGPLIIGAGTAVRDSRLGPYTSIGPDCTLADTSLAYSIVLNGARIEGTGPLEGCLIGRHATVAPAAPAPHRLILGDHSEVRIRS
ncbi:MULTISPECIES: glucose-1-phosphate thymidylyltransferase [Streptomyces]|uniref:Glucose-1-phosphate thymidylyltransferase n=1 Tax=Streptomyces albus (strain ATCC 21838 / DSM 41398 / FERM P-419 / JCM 4703 / NBRC 107858) TaxID=1081613 RepID=A0A0B5F217_STRA4|nr:glucose-1-phosphate thymidylyltransferase [Streptomyces sp. SCSIO ZS0520]AJE84342.1 glucose-1-phosphate thymidylyltransferase [Streptomyces albus]AOU78651.1 glucose-1-phosphate thymidylyltransferase [Streptomyces albus]AYN34392.1 glucose-1-phosphate thymidylyltransferase [Streptomyces albus]